MTDDRSSPDQPATDQPASDQPASDQPDQPPPPKTRLRDRVLGFRAVVAVALAALILGGLGGAAVGVVASGDERRGPDGGPGFRGGPDGQHRHGPAPAPDDTDA